MPKLVKNIETIGISNISANGIITLNINLKYLSTVNNSLNMPSFNDNKNGTIKLVNNIYPNTSPITNKKNTAGTYAKDVVLSCFFKPGFMKSHNCKLNIGNVPTTARIPAIDMYIQIISAIPVTVNLKSISASKNPYISCIYINPIIKNKTKNTSVTIIRFLNSVRCPTRFISTSVSFDNVDTPNK